MPSSWHIGNWLFRLVIKDYLDGEKEYEKYYRTVMRGSEKEKNAYDSKELRLIIIFVWSK